MEDKPSLVPEDPFLSRCPDLVETLFDHMPMGIAVLDCDLVLRRCNPTWAEYVGRYTPTLVSQVVPGVCVRDLIPGAEATIAPILARVLAGEMIRQDALCLESHGVVFYWDAAFVPLRQQGEITGVLIVITDATERVSARQTLEQRVADRTRELSALHDVMTAASSSLDLQPVMERSLNRVLAAIESRAGAIHLLDEAGKTLRLAAVQGIQPDAMGRIGSVPVDEGMAGWIIEHEEPLVVPSIADSPRPLLALPATRTQAYLGVPVRARGRVLGVLSVIGEAGRQFNQGEVSLLVSIADQVGSAVENAQLYQQAEQLAVIRERQRLARELHDSVAQSLYSLVLLAEAGRRLAGAGDMQRVEEAVARLGEIGQQALKEMRLLVYEMRPLDLGKEGLVRALQQRLDAVEKRAGVEAYLQVEGSIELAESVQAELYRIVQEALNNALKHAAATSVAVHIRSKGKRTEVEVVDNGKGFDPHEASGEGGIGLLGMMERTERLGGTLNVSSAPGRGTRVQVVVDGSCE